jgi:hypothetical protein
MGKFSFDLEQRKHQEIWRKTNISTSERGFQNKRDYEHIIPRRIWTETLWKAIRLELPVYLDQKKIQHHTGTHNLLSSWVACANLYFPVRQNATLRIMMAEFLRQKISDHITEITDVELEFAFPLNDQLHPSILLGEEDGTRGSGQTSPDVAFLIKTKQGNGIVLAECKYTEHSFYRCSARRTNARGEHEGNPDPERCLESANVFNYKTICHQTVWKRKYWNNLILSKHGKAILKRCPATSAGYQLFRQQSLAEGIMKSGKYSLVASSVAFDDRNTALKACLRSTGIPDFQTGWGGIFEGRAIFRTWTHQEWVEFVRKNQVKGQVNDWLKYIQDRYAY